MGNESRRLKSVNQLAREYVHAASRMASRLSANLGLERASYEAEVLGCIWFAGHLDCVQMEDAIPEVRDLILRRWDSLELQVSFEEALPLDGELSVVAERVDEKALRRNLVTKFEGLRPALAAHELMLQAGNSKRRSSRGVYTTPLALADFLVNRADSMLRDEFHLKLGIADTATWREVSDRVQFLIPEGVDAEQPFIRIMDAATGSGVFPLAIARRARLNWLERWRAEGIPTEVANEMWESETGPELAKRIVLHEILPVTRTLARWHLTGVFGDATPTIESANPLEEFDALPFPITVSLGNPPYSVRSGSMESAARSLVEPYRYESGKRIVEKGALRLEMHLQDDYVKFIRLAEMQIERAGVGVMSLVTNHSFLDSPSLRGMRCCLAKRFDRIELLNLHGSRTRKTEEQKRVGDENVFAIGQGVATIVASSSGGEINALTYAELMGPKSEKLEMLSNVARATDSNITLSPKLPNWYFIPRDTRYSAIYDEWIGLKDLFQSSVSGIVTAHDHLVVGFNDEDLRDQAKLLVDESLSTDEVRDLLRVRDNAGWKFERARDRFRADPNRDNNYRDYAYRPFDTRRLLYHSSLVWCDRRRVMSALDGERNVALAVCRQLAAPPWNHVFATRELMDDNYVSNRSRERTHLFPLFRRLNPGDASSPLISNLNEDAVQAIVPNGLSVSSDDLFSYVYAILHSPSYRERHCDSLAVDFPRVPPARDKPMFERFVDSGRELLNAHLPNSLTRQSIPLDFEGAGPAIVERGFPLFKNERVFLNEDYSLGPVTEAQWNFVIGSYAPCRKWLKDRVSRLLTPSDLAAYERLVCGVAASLKALDHLPELALKPRQSAFVPS